MIAPESVGCAEIFMERRRFRKKTLFIGAVGLALVVALSVTYLRFQSSTSPLPPLPTPNGFDEIVRAAHLVDDQHLTKDIRQADVSELRVLVESHREALQAVRLGLAIPCRVPQILQRNIQSTLDRASAVRNLGRILFAEGKLAETNN